MTAILVLPLPPVGKPRMTQRDKWAPSAAAKRYLAFRDNVLTFYAVAGKPRIPAGGLWFVFHLAMPPSWSKKDREAMCGTPHQQKPDVDNLVKAMLDALFEEDRLVWDVRATKIWALAPCIEVFETPDHHRYGEFTP